MLRAVLFDLQGTLLDDEPLRLRLLCELASEQGVTCDPASWAERLAGTDDRTALALLWAEARRPLAPELVRPLLAEKARRYEAAIAGRPPLHPGATALVEEAARRVPVGVVASVGSREAAAVLKEAGLFRRLSALVSADEIGRPLPAPEGWSTCLAAIDRMLAARRMEAIPPRSVLCIDDTEAGIRAAHAAGMKVAAVGHTQRSARLAAADAHVGRILDLDLATLERELF